ncbi:MgtC/SapB family protein [Fulvivirga lutea]|uniref:MgtC/SapB family protein n=2 Tax=Fulvivirga lutea TaxID=2810512 RepID=A0A974WLE1_9BACT|nr:MgtC/SapB family protein [Fulvivirga lutea]
MLNLVGELIHPEELAIFGDVVIATLLTMVVGYEREKADKEAGLRTNMIVGGATCLIILLSKPIILFLESNYPNSINADPIRLFEAIVVGISFLGAGTILKKKDEHNIYGITTAATLLYSSGIGICVALHHYLLAVLLTVFILIVNYVVHRFSKGI